MRDGVSGVGRTYPDDLTSASAVGSTDVARPASPHRGAKVLFGELFTRHGKRSYAAAIARETFAFGQACR